jgi:hypothetical protein
MKNITLQPASAERRKNVPIIGTHAVMEREALILRARAEQAKLDALYCADESERRDLEGLARAYEAHARQLEDSLDGWGDEASSLLR